MPSRLCALPKAPEDLLDDIVVPEAKWILDDLDDLPFEFGSRMPIYADELLREAMNHAPEPKGKAWLARIIYPTDGDRQKLQEIATLLLKELLLPMKGRNFKLPTKGVPIAEEDEIPLEPGQQNGYASLRNTLLAREGNCCCISRHSPTNSTGPKAIPAGEPLELTYIIPPTLGDHCDDHEKLVYDPCVFWEVLQHYAPSLDFEWLRAGGVNTASNSMMLCQTVQKAFVGLELGLVETKIPGTYDVQNWMKDPWIGHKYDFGHVTIKNHSNVDADLPDPDLLRIHACVCRIINAGGAGRALDRVIKDAYRIPHLEPDGTTDIESMFSLLLTLPKPTPPWTP